MKKKQPEWIRNFDRVAGKEKACINCFRAAARVPEDQPFAGLALSGGGIRSAAFGMGVLQGMVYHDRLRDIDYISSVSGGGYIATSLTWWLTQGCGTSPRDFPFGTRPGTDRPDSRGDQILNYIRQHAEYLTPGRGLNSLSLFAVIMRGIFSSLFVYFQFMIVLMGVVFTLIPAALSYAGASDTVARYYPLYTAGTLVCLLIIGAILYSFFVGTLVWGPIPMPGYRFSIRAQIGSGHVWAIALTLAFISTIPWAYDNLPDRVSSLIFAKGALKTLGKLSAELGALSTVLAGIVKALHGGGALTGKGKKSGAKVAGISVLAFAVIYIMLLLAYHVGDSMATRFPNRLVYLALCAAIALGAGGLGMIANLNFVGHHRMYRDRLMELFLADEKTVMDNVWRPAAGASQLELAEAKTRPYQIVNTNVVLIDSNVPRYRGRGGDSFILSPWYSGSSATGWRLTKDFRWLETHGMTLSTAMAISGAALNPDTGAAGVGPTRKRLISMLMTLLNIRLGYWTPGPRGPLTDRANYVFPGIQALLGVGFHEHARMIELTDGGHFDNLGLYELIHRRVPRIIISDAGCDPRFSFNDLASVIERVRTDFGAIITFRTGENEDLGGLVPRKKGTTEQTRRIKLARRGYAIADVAYCNGATGVILYIKSTLIAGLPLDVYDYKRKHEAFPDETTADQFFDERQFEAYRELGYHITKAALAATGGHFPS